MFPGCIADSGENNRNNESIAGNTAAFSNQEEGHQTLQVYCSAGMRRPMDEIGTMFEEEYRIPVQYNYAGANTLLTQMELTVEGDVYMPGATYYFEVASEKGLIGNSSKVAYHVPVIITPPDNPANINDLEDLANDDVDIILGDSRTAAIGILCETMLTNKGIYEQVEENVVARGATVNELVTYISLGQADASIVWEDLVRGNEDFNIIKISEEDNIIRIIPIATLTSSENPVAATYFVDLVVSDKGRGVFEEYGFTLYPNEKYAYLESN
ncbi:MAG: molybdate ABC transporter substrate-binding protein [Methanosarcinaceae archaeon]|nr:molybdate ABC transporter substrate-binding protein [Methanosarcinaceae archaeon]